MNPGGIFSPLSDPPPVPVVQIVRRHRLFEGLPEEEIRHLLALTEDAEYSRQHTVFVQGDACRGFYLVLSGVVRLFKMAPDGREHVVEVIREGQSFAEAVVFAGEAYPVYAETLTESRLLFFPKAQYLKFLQERPHFLFGLIATLSVRMHQLVAKVESLTLQDAQQRVAGFFVDFRGRGDDHEKTLDIAKGVLASQMGLTPETLSRTLQVLQSQGLIVMHGRHFEILDRAGLIRLASGGASKG